MEIKDYPNQVFFLFHNKKFYELNQLTPTSRSKLFFIIFCLTQDWNWESSGNIATWLKCVGYYNQHVELLQLWHLSSAWISNSREYKGKVEN